LRFEKLKNPVEKKQGKKLRGRKTLPQKRGRV